MKESSALKSNRKPGGGWWRMAGTSVVYAAYVGLDVHKDSIAVSVAEAGRGESEDLGEIANTAKAVKRLVERLSRRFGGEALLFSYEAGACGYVVYHQIVGLGQECEVVAPSLIPRRAGDRVKTDRRDARMLARLSRAGELTAVWVPDGEQEAMRDLTRAREDLKALELKTRQRLGAFVLRHGKRYTAGKSRWTQRHLQWLEGLRFDSPAQQVVLQEYLEMLKDIQRRIATLGQQMHQALASWSLAPVVEALMALRGVSLTAAVGLLAELGDLSRFDSPRQLMGYLGLVPSEISSGGTPRQGGITKTGNGHARRLLVECSWAYQYPARKTREIQQRAEKTSAACQRIAWQAQKRLCGRYQALLRVGKNTKQVTTAIARELVGFIWALAREVQGLPHASRATA